MGNSSSITVITLMVCTGILVGTCLSQGIKAQTTLLAATAQLRTSGSVPSSNSSGANIKPNVSTTASSNNTSHQAAVPLLSSLKSSPVSSAEDSQQQKQQAKLSQGHHQQRQRQRQLQQTNQLQQQQGRTQSNPIDPRQVLPPSFPYQLQQQGQPPPPISPYPQQQLYPYQYPYLQQQQLQQQQQPLVPPIANAGVSQIVDANTNVMLDGRNSFVPMLGQQQANTTTIVGVNNNKMIIAYQWTQLPVGVPVNITGANTPTPTFTAPMLPYDTTLAFSLRVMSNDGLVSTNQAMVYVMVKHYYSGSNSGISSGTPLQQQPYQQPQQLQSQQPQSTPTPAYPYPYPYTYPPNR
jgi:hypothetical protein